MSLVETVAQAVYDAGWATAIRESEVVFPVLEAVHVIGLALVAGTIAIVDLRLLGLVLRDAPASEVERRIVPITWAGFAVMALTGSLLLGAEAAKIVHNPALIVKLAALALVGINVAVFHWKARPALRATTPGAPVPASARAGAIVSLLLWLVVIAAGRAIAYF
jgi:hypothetical protein